MVFDWLKGSAYINPLIRLGYTVVDDVIHGGSANDNSFSEWLLNGEWSQEKYEEYLVYTKIPGFSQYIEYLKALQDNAQYMHRNQLQWSDVRNPWNLPGSRGLSGVISYGIDAISDNFKRLYK